LVELQLPCDHPALALHVRIHGNGAEILRLQRQFNRTVNRQRSGKVMAGMLLLLAVCGWIFRRQ
jgi:hypothetical protein